MTLIGLETETGFELITVTPANIATVKLEEEFGSMFEARSLPVG
jgi:hypothetical protein